MRIVVGIDPDCKKSGVATIDGYGNRIEVRTLDFSTLIDYIVKLSSEHDVWVYVEAGWKITHNWHTQRNDKPSVAAKKGYSVGRNHETGIKIVEMCRYHGVQVQEVKPLRKIWDGRDKKITHDGLLMGTKMNIKKRTNQEERDAALIAFIYRK